MPTFIFIYRNPTRYVPIPETTAGMKAWFDGMGKQLVELGKPVLASDTAGNLSPGTTELELNGYSIIQAENLAAALAIAKECPHLTRNGQIEVGELGEVPTPNRRVSMVTSTDEPTPISVPVVSSRNQG